MARVALFPAAQWPPPVSERAKTAVVVERFDARSALSAVPPPRSSAAVLRRGPPLLRGVPGADVRSERTPVAYPIFTFRWLAVHALVARDPRLVVSDWSFGRIGETGKQRSPRIGSGSRPTIHWARGVSIW